MDCGAWFAHAGYPQLRGMLPLASGLEPGEGDRK
jgi:hypothetical protein